MFYINDKTGEKITKLFEEKKLNKDEYFDIMEYLSIDTFKDILKSSHIFLEIYVKMKNDKNDIRTLVFLKTSRSISLEIKKILFVDYVHKFADMISMSCFLNKQSLNVINNKKLLKTIIGKIDDAGTEGYEFNKIKLEIIEQHFERV